MPHIARYWNSRTYSLLVLTLLLLSRATSAQQQPAADAVVINAKIYTVNTKQPWAEALAIRGDKIVAVGREKDVAPYRGPSTKVVDAKGHLVLPGFTDCHIHFMDGSLGLMRVDLNGADSIEEIQKRVKEYADSHPKEPWILGMGWSYPTFAPSGLPNKKILDDVVPDRPVYLVAFDGHSSWANSKALELAGITKKTADPANGKIERDDKGEATGALK
ncbi:MAG TPA: amidohydrolase family protein, partial [Terriglobales bacterium]